MKRNEVIEELKKGGQIAVSDASDMTCHLKTIDGRFLTVDIRTFCNLREAGFLNSRISKTSLVAYFTWKAVK